MNPIIEVSELLEIYHTKNVLIVDASNEKDARHKYESKHLDGALFIDTNADLAEVPRDFANGGRHPLPSLEKFSNVLSNLGINKVTHVVIYDNKSGANAAARFWWMLASIGHEQVQVLNGGLQYAEKFGFSINDKKVIPQATTKYEVNNWQFPLVNISEVEMASQSKNHLVIDVREANRYNGISEPIDLVAGHIPGAINVPFIDNMNNEGFFLSPNELKGRYESILGNISNENTIVHCGSGITACHTLLAIVYAGLKIPQLYVGSWSEWSRSGKQMVFKK
jgi:thiosulfate/3-mercaptopyruvate sulfurtransferase